MGSLTKDKLIFDPADAADSDNIGAYLRAGSDGDLLSSTLVSGKEGLDVNVINGVNVTATNLDIRDLAFATDSVTAYQGTSPWVISGTATVSATDLDIRDLSHTQDSIKIGDGADFMLISAAGEANVVLSATSGIFAEDAAHTSGDNGQFMLAVRNDSAATTLTSANGDYSPIAVDNKGRVIVAADFNVTSDFVYAEDSASADADQLASVGGVRQDTLASSTSADGDYGNLKQNARGALWTAPVGTVADNIADTENPAKIGSRAVSGALAAVSATGNRADLLSDMYRRIFINDSPNINLNSQVLTVGATEIAFPAALAGRRRIMVQNSSSNPIYVGPTGVLSTTGLKIEKGATLSLEAGQAINFFAIAGSAGNAVRIFELA